MLKITENQPVRYFNTTFQEARNLGALMLFGEKYGDLVRVVEIDGFSRELCGGTHVRGTAEVGAFKILSNRKHGADVYRIEVLTGREALRYLLDSTEKAEKAASSLQVELERFPETVEELQGEVREAREAARQQAMKKGLEQVGELIQNAISADGGHVVVGQVTAADVQSLRQISDDVRNRIGAPAAVVLAAEADGKPILVSSVHADLCGKVEAGELVREVAGLIGGGGGGGAKMAQGGGGDVSAIPSALDKARDLLVDRFSGEGQKPS
jgi:alanyl-tRNA synthetase